MLAVHCGSAVRPFAPRIHQSILSETHPAASPLDKQYNHAQQRQHFWHWKRRHFRFLDCVEDSLAQVFDVIFQQRRSAHFIKSCQCHSIQCALLFCPVRKIYFYISTAYMKRTRQRVSKISGRIEIRDMAKSMQPVSPQNHPPKSLQADCSFALQFIFSFLRTAQIEGSGVRGLAKGFDWRIESSDASRGSRGWGGEHTWSLSI